MDLRNELVNRLKRGKVDVNVNIEYKEGRQAIQINAVNIMNYYRQLKALSDQMGISSYRFTAPGHHAPARML